MNLFIVFLILTVQTMTPAPKTINDKNFSYNNQYYTDALANEQNPSQAVAVEEKKTEEIPWNFPHFKPEEFNQSSEPLPVDLLMQKMNPLLIQRLELLRELIGNRPIVVNSGYRTATYNKKVGGAKASQHMFGNAADIIVNGMTSDELEPLAKKAGFTFTKTYKDKPHLHVDVRGLKNAE